jgi:hypothetical protein
MQTARQGEIDTINTLEEKDLIEEFDEWFEELMLDRETPMTETEINDFLRFEDDYIFEALGVEDEEDEEDEE